MRRFSGLAVASHTVEMADAGGLETGDSTPETTSIRPTESVVASHGYLKVMVDHSLDL